MIYLIQKYWEKWLKITEKNKDRIISKSTSDICTTGSILPYKYITTLTMQFLRDFKHGCIIPYM